MKKIKLFDPLKMGLVLAECLSVLFVFNKPSYAQQNANTLTIKGDLGPLSPLVSKVFLQRTIYDYTNWGYHSVMDSCICKDGTYSFKAKQKDAAWGVLQIVYDTNALKKNGLRKPAREYRAIELICYKENVTVSTKDSFFNNSIIKGSKATEEYLKFQKIYSPLDSAYRAKLSECAVETDLAKFEMLRAQADSLKKGVLLYFADFLMLNPGTSIYPVVLQYVSFFPEDMDQEILQSLYDNLNKEIKVSIHGKEIKNKLDALNNVKMGGNAIDFSRKDTSGNEVTLSSLKGKYILLEFWGSWCKPCRAQNPHLIQVYETFRDKGFEILGIAYEGGVDSIAISKWLAAINKDKLPWKNVLSETPDNKGKNLSQLYNVNSYPTSYLIDPKGIIIAKNLRGEILEKKLSELLR